MPFEITRTELVWPGKYDEDGNRREPPRVSLPFQVIERVNESRATREAEKRQDLTLFDVWKGDEGETFEEGWHNKLIWGDNLLVTSSLLDQFAGKIDLIYIDPPFATGADFRVTTLIGDGSVDALKEQSILEEKAYRDTWGHGLDSYVEMLLDRLALMRVLLTDTGTIYVHTDHRIVSHVKLLCDQIFGSERMLNVITWRRQIPRGMKTHARHMPFSADFLLMYAKGEEAKWNEVKKEVLISLEEAERKYMRDERGFFRTSDPGTYSNDSLLRLHKEGRIYVTKGGEVQIKNGILTVSHGSIGIKYYREQRGDKVVEETVVDNIWDDVPGMGIVSSEYVGFPTQKPKGLLRRIIEASSQPNDLIGDFFCGSGTTMVVAEETGRRWVGCDLSRFAIHLSRKRLLDVADCRSFEVLNLGKYERQYWRVATFGEDLDEDGSIALYEYIAFILRLYGATAVSGMGSLHGKMGKAFVHVGAVDSPVTIQEIAEAIEECKAVKGTELHVLGWEWEMGVNDLMVEQARPEGVKLLLRQIPREVMETQAAGRGDVRFFELAYVEFEVKPTRAKRTFQVVLRDFAIPNPELVPDEVRSKIKKWSDYVDYWAVDWEFREDTFMQGWVTYRTRKDRSLELKSDIHTYEEPGEYAVMVKVIDIFGNDTSKVVRIQVK